MNQAEDGLEMVCALVEGGTDTPPWSRFLSLLRDATGADYATLMFRSPGRPFTEAVSMLSGGTMPSLEESYRASLYPRDLMVNKALEEGRPYALEELVGPPGGVEFRAHREYLEMHGISALRQLRVREPSGVDAWLTISRSGPDFAPADDQLMSRVAKVLRGVLCQHVALERERFEASLTREATRRMQFGWFTLDAEECVLDCDLEGARVLVDSGVLSRGPTGRLVARPAKLQREISRALAHLVKAQASRPLAISLSRDPWLDMLLLPAEKRSISARGAPVAIAYVHGDSWRTAECGEQLAELFRLSPREAQIALALCRGMTIGEVALDLGLTVGTARNHTKSLYAKTGARGLPDLVRIVMRSVLAMAGGG
jgi:DNA-binding CsgD family transcriptional regulator